LSDRPSSLLKETSKLGCGGDQLNDRMLRSISETVLCVTGNFNEIPWSSRNPMSLATLFAEHFNVPRKNEEGLVSGVAMYWHRNVYVLSRAVRPFSSGYMDAHRSKWDRESNQM
jgi:hypothetical protein